MKFKIVRSKFLVGLASIQNIVAAHSREHLTLIAEAIGDSRISSSAALRHGLVKEYNRTHKGDCPICGGHVRSTIGNDFEEVLVCDSCHNEITDDLKSAKFYRVSESGMAEFVRKRLGLDFAQQIGGGNYRLGKLHDKKVFFCASPTPGFYNTHNKDSILILCDIESVPRDWASNGCHAFPFSEIFYEKHAGTEIGMAEDLINDLKPAEPNRRFGKNRLIHKRRDCWLMVLMNIFANPYQEKDFRNGELTTVAAKKWFAKVLPRIKMCARTFKRDMEDFSSYDKKKDTYDKREPLVTQLLKLAADPTFTKEKRIETANAIKVMLEQVRSAKVKNGGVPVELPETAWAVGADGHSERVQTTSAETIYEAVDDSLRQEGHRHKAA